MSLALKPALPPVSREGAAVRAPADKGTVGAIQGLRFLASAMVLIGHLNHEAVQRAAEFAAFQPFEPVWWAGGVDIFFVISGFIMYFIAADQFGKPGAASSFMRKRLMRLVPPYWLFTSLALLAMAVVPSQMAVNRAPLANVIGSYLFVPTGNAAGQMFPVLILGWTLNFEMLFYGIFAAGLLLPKRYGLVLIAFILLALSLAGFANAAQGAGPLGFWCNPIVLEFLFGIGIAMLRRTGLRLDMGAAGLVIGLGLGSLVAMHGLGVTGAFWAWRFVWAGLPAAILVGGAALMPPLANPGPLMRFIVLGGDASFALYLSHPFVLSLLAMVVARTGGMAPQIYVATGFVCCLGAAIVLHIFGERPLHDHLRTRLGPSRGAAGVAHA